MRVHLIHNPKAGQNDHGEERLLDALRARGFSAELLSADGGRSLLRELPSGAEELLVVAGGDGTVGRAFLVVARSSCPLSVIPLGTANNIAFSLGIDEFPAVLTRPGAPGVTRQVALGRLRGPTLARCFVESVGFGLLTALMKADEHPDPPLPPDLLADEHGVRRPQRILRYLLEHWPARPYRIEVDGQDHSGEYLLVEALNIPRIGPGLLLAPQQAPDSGSLTLALLEPAEREAFAAFLDALAEGRDPAEAPVRRISGRHIRVQARGGDMHVDDDWQPIEAEGDWVIDADVRRVPVRV